MHWSDTALLTSFIVKTLLINYSSLGVPVVAQQVKDLALSLQGLRWLLWRGFGPGLGTCTSHERNQKNCKSNRGFGLIVEIRLYTWGL